MNNPKPYTLVHAIGSNNKSWIYPIYWDPEQELFVEPVMNKPAESIIGKIIYWEPIICRNIVQSFG